MNMQEHIDVEDLTMFALVLLSAEDAETVKTHLAGCLPCREELQQIHRDLELYALSVEPVAVPESARTRFLSEMAKPDAGLGQRHDAFPVEPAAPAFAGKPVLLARTAEPGVAGEARLPGTTRGKVLPWVSWIGWAAAAAALVVAAGLRQDRDALRSALTAQNAQTVSLEADAHKARQILGTLTDPSAVRVSLTVPKAAPSPAARATYSPRSGTLLLMASNLAPLPAQKVYELWLIPADGSAPVPAGTFSPDARGNASLLTPALHGAVAAKAFGITVEPVGGSATPTVPILLAGSAG